MTEYECISTGPVVTYTIMEDGGEPKMHMSIDKSKWYPVENVFRIFESSNDELMNHYWEKKHE